MVFQTFCSLMGKVCVLPASLFLYYQASRGYGLLHIIPEIGGLFVHWVRFLRPLLKAAVVAAP